MSRHSRLYSLKAWKDRREDQLTREPLCRFHLQRGQTVAATIADHVERHRGDLHKFLTIPLQSLCKTCHDSAKQSEELHGFSKEAGVDGWPVDPRHAFNRRRP